MSRTRQIDPTVKYFPPRLLKKLEYIRSYPMTLIEAPSGFGKTTLLEYFFSEKLPQSVPLSTYDFESDQRLNIWRQICLQIGRIDRSCGERLRQCGEPDEDNLREIAQILRELRCPYESYLWLDNYKRWNNEFAEEFLTMLGRHGGEELHVVVTTQPLPGQRQLVVSEGSMLWQMGDEDLTFHKEDIAAYFSAAGLPLSETQLEEVYGLTEGWIMALSLQLLCYMNRGEFERGGMMALMEHTFWGSLTQKEKDFLLKISIFQRFNLAQATALSGRSPEETDRLLRNKRYFIHFDSETRSFYPHSQVRSLLEGQFHCLPPEQQKAIYLQGAQLAEREQDRLNTLRFYYMAGAWEQFLEQPITSYEIADIMSDEAKPVVLDILERAPREVKLRHPRAILGLAFALFIMGENGKLMEKQREIQSIIEEGEISQEERNSLTGEMELLLSFLEYNRISDMSARHRKALELLGGPARLISPKSVWTFGSPSVLCLYWREIGKLDEELEEMDTCMPIYYRLTNNHGFGAELVMRAETHLMRGEVDRALPLCYQALFAASSHHQDSIYQCGLFLLCRLSLLQGDMETLHTTLQNLREISGCHREDLSRYTADLAESVLSLDQGQPDQVSPWLSQGDINEKRLVMMVQPEAYIVYGRCLLLQKAYWKLLGVSQHFLGLSRVFPNLLPQVYAHIYCACARYLLGEREEAVQLLQQGLDLAMTDRVYLPFAENYRSILPLLPLVQLGREHRSRIEALAACFPELKPADEPFTPREKEILALLRDGLTNKEIALRMNLSPNTIRNVISGMLRKRKVETRQQLAELPEI